MDTPIKSIRKISLANENVDTNISKKYLIKYCRGWNIVFFSERFDGIIYAVEGDGFMFRATECEEIWEIEFTH